MKNFKHGLAALVALFLPALQGMACVAPVGPEDAEVMDEGEMVDAEEDSVEQVSQEVIGSCHGAVTCPDPKSCGSWSTFTSCGTTCVADRQCGGCGSYLNDPECVPDGTKKTLNYHESFRSCVLQNGSTCTEYKQAITGGACGC